jgi:hypothetical protein
LVGAVGLGLIATAILCNHWLLAFCFSADGSIAASNRLLIWLFEAATLALGLLLVLFRRRIPPFALIVTPLFVLIGLGVVEVLLRAIEPRPLAVARENPSGTGSYRLKPNLDLTYLQAGRRVRVKTNAHGMRWRKVATSKSVGTERIAFLGDSFTFGIAAGSIERSLVGVFDSLVDRSKYEVLNFGVVGYGFPDIRLQLEEEVLPFTPDYIILATFNGNDFHDSYLGADKYYVADGVIEMDWDAFRKKVPGAYQPEREFAVTGDAPSVPKGLRLVDLLRRSLGHVANNGFTRPTRGPAGPDRCAAIEFVVATEFVYPSFWSAQRYPDVADSAKNVSLSELSRIHALCETHGARLLIVAIPTKEQVYAKIERGVDRNGRAYDINLPQRYVKTWAEEHGVACLDLLPALRRIGLAEGVCLFPPEPEVHLNDRGHAIAGREILEFFRSTTQRDPESQVGT